MSQQNVEIDSELGRLVELVPRELSPNDEMYAFDQAWTSYLWVAASALRCVRRSMRLAGKETVRSVLDFACGHGRVLRVLKVAFPEARLAGADINEDGVRFCSRVLGATPLASDPDPSQVRLEQEFDLVWCGSLFNHLDAPRLYGFLVLISRALVPGGLFVFTTHGRQIADALRRGVPDPELTREGIDRMLRGYDRDGFGYSDYPWATGWGDSIVRPAWVRSALESCEGLRFVDYLETGW